MSQAWEHARQACERAESSQSEQIGLSEKKTLLLEALNRVRTALGVGGRDTAAEDAVHCAESVLYSEKDTIIRWQDGPLLRALKDGLWLVLENANLCSPSVLDRLNPLLEPGGQLLVNEAGGGEDLHDDAQNHVIKPHEGPETSAKMCWCAHAERTQMTEHLEKNGSSSRLRKNRLNASRKGGTGTSGLTTVLPSTPGYIMRASCRDS